MKTNILLVSQELTYFKSVALRSLPKRYLHLAEDLAQDAILKSIEKIDQYDPAKGNFKSWLYRLTQNVCFDAIRKLNRLEVVPLSFDVVSGDYCSTENAHAIAAAEIKIIRRAMHHLNVRDRQLILCKFMFNLNGKEMSQLLDIPENQVNVYFQRAKARLKDLYLKAA